MNLSIAALAATILLGAASALMGFGIWPGVVLGIFISVLMFMAFGNSAKKNTGTNETSNTYQQPNSSPKSSKQATGYDPKAVLREIEGAFVQIKGALSAQDSAVQKVIYDSLRDTLAYLPATPTQGASELWSTVRQELLKPIQDDLRLTSDREASLKRIEERCASFPLTLQALATTLLPEGTTVLRDQSGATYYLDNLQSMPAFETVLTGRDIEKLGPGAYFRIGDELFPCKERFLYREGNSMWHEVLGESLRSGEITALEWEVDDHQLEIIVQEGPALRLEELGLQQKDLEKFDDNEEGSFRFRGETFHYDESDQATCESVESGEKESFYYYDFIGSPSKTVLGVERWGSETKAYLMKPILARDLNIILP